VIPQCVDQGVAIIPYSPLARGYLAGTRNRDRGQQTTRASEDAGKSGLYGGPVDFEIIDRVIELARTRRVEPAQIALAWHLHKPAVTAPIIGATRVEHIDQALAATGLALSEPEIAALEEPYRPRDVIIG
jgi:aryl-alcohol dehydrogenase-like predicted oxidoreductase